MIPKTAEEPWIYEGPQTPTERINESIQTQKKLFGLNTGEVSDGYHTFDELYECRNRLFITLVKKVSDENHSRAVLSHYKGITPIWRSRFHDDGSSYPGWFVLGIGRMAGDIITFHLPDRYWDECSFARVEAKAYYDGHNTADALQRLAAL